LPGSFFGTSADIAFMGEWVEIPPDGHVPQLVLREFRAGSKPMRSSMMKFLLRNRPFKILISSVAALCVSACSGVLFGGMNSLSGSKSLEQTRDITFDEANALQLDVYRPAQTQDATVVVFFYGGNWRNGERGDYRWVGEALAREGVVAIIPDYRKFPIVRLDGFMSDAASAVAWAKAHAVEYGGNPERLVVMGHSAGAHLGALLVTDARWLEAKQMVPKDVCGFVGLAGPYDFAPITNPDLREIFGERSAEQQRSQPIRFVDGDEPPMLLLHGSADTTVYPRNTEHLGAALNKAGVTEKTVIYPGLTHVRMLLGLSGRFAKDAPIMSDSMQFIRTCR